MYLASGGTYSLLAMIQEAPQHWGFLVRPDNLVRLPDTQGEPPLCWAADNGAFTHFDPDLFRLMLERLRGLSGCLFIACPDVVADARATCQRFAEWSDEVRQTGQPVAFVGQDGAEEMEIPWDDLDAWFIGGSTEWKLSAASCRLAHQAKERGKWLHMGRVNTRRRLLFAFDLGCDSVDGSGPLYGDGYTRKLFRWLRQLHQQPTLF